MRPRRPGRWILRGRWRRRLLLLALTLVAVDQLVLYTVLADDRLLGQPIAPFDPPLFHGRQLARLAELRAGDTSGSAYDLHLGWAPRPGRRSPIDEHDQHGARVLLEPTRDTPDARRLALIGCSFTHGDEVLARQSFAGQLDLAREDLEVWNYGVGAYGLGQVLLRLERDVLPRGPDQVWLGWSPFTSLRATTCFPPLQHHWAGTILFKPCFFLKPGGGLGLAPNPARTHRDALRLLGDQDALLDALAGADFWVRRAPAAYAPRGTSWLHRSALARLALSAHERGQRGVAAWLRDPSSEPTRLVTALVLAMAERCEQAGVEFALVVLPSYVDLAGEPYWSGITRALMGEGLEVIDTSEALRTAGALEDESMWMPGGHYSPGGHEIVCRRLLQALD